MKTWFCSIAGDDLTGPPVLKLHKSVNFDARLPFATPSRAWLPRNIGQLSAHAESASKENATTQPYAWLLTFKFIASNEFYSGCLPRAGIVSSTLPRRANKNTYTY